MNLFSSDVNGVTSDGGSILIDPCIILPSESFSMIICNAYAFPDIMHQKTTSMGGFIVFLFYVHLSELFQ